MVTSRVDGVLELEIREIAGGIIGLTLLLVFFFSIQSANTAILGVLA